MLGGVIINKALFTSNSQEWYTPKWLFNYLNDKFKFRLDPCSNGIDRLCYVNYTIKDNGLDQLWLGPVFVNPPYNDILRWVNKAIEELEQGTAETVVFLVPSRTDTQWFYNMFPYIKSVGFIRGRVRFSNSGPAPFPSMVVEMSKGHGCDMFYIIDQTKIKSIYDKEGLNND